MAQAGDNIKQWLLIGEYYDQKVADGLSPHAAEQAIRREGHQRQFDYRCRNEAGRQVDAPDNLWIAGSLDFATSWVTVPVVPDPSASLMAEAARRVQNAQAAVERVSFRGVAQGESSGSREIPRRQDSRRFFVEVFVEVRPVAPIQTDAERNTGTEPVDPNPDAERNTGTEPVDPNPDAERNTGTEPVDPIAATTSAPLSDGVADAGSAETVVELREAPRDGTIIREIIRAVYDEAENTNTKSPNINELPGKVKLKLKDRGYKAARKRIKDIGEEQEFKRRRPEPGRRWRGNRN